MKKKSKKKKRLKICFYFNAKCQAMLFFQHQFSLNLGREGTMCKTEKGDIYMSVKIWDVVPWMQM